MATIFVSPGVYTKEQDFSVFASRIGITRLGLVGKTAKGPAFEPIKVSTSDEYLLRFGGTDPELPLSYVANAFLGQSNELTVTRILGSSGFLNSPAWLLVADMSTTYEGSTTASGMTLTADGISASTIFDFITSASTTLTTTGATATTVGTSTRVAYSGAVSTATWLAAINTTPFSGFGITVVGSTGSTLITSGAPITFYVSAHTVDVNSGYVYLSRLV